MIYAILITSLISLVILVCIAIKVYERQTSSADGIILADDTKVLAAIEGARNQMDVLGDEIKPRLKAIDEDVNWLAQQWRKFSKNQ